MGKSTPSEATPAKTRSSKGDPPPAPAPEPEDEGGGSADEVEKELGGGVSEALAEFKAAIGAAGPAPTLGKQDEWRVALAALRSSSFVDLPPTFCVSRVLACYASVWGPEYLWTIALYWGYKIRNLLEN